MKNAILLASALGVALVGYIDAGIFSRKYDNTVSAETSPNTLFLTSAFPESAYGWYLFTDALYWHADVGSADWAIKNPDIIEMDKHLRNRSLDFKWAWGFRVGLGANINHHDMWDSNIYYTWFRAHNSRGAGVNPDAGSEQGTLFSLGDATTGALRWNIVFSMLDGELGRWYELSPALSWRPHVGIKGGWIHQDVHVRFLNQAPPPPIMLERVTGHYKNHFWGIGPSLGVNSLWDLGHVGDQRDHRLSLFGDFGGALMYGHFSVNGGAADIGLGKIGLGNLGRNLAVTMLQGMLGFSWDTPFNRDRNHFMLKVGYELQYWFRQNQFVRYELLSGDFRRCADDLTLQGLSTEFRFDF